MPTHNTKDLPEGFFLAGEDLEEHYTLFSIACGKNGTVFWKLPNVIWENVSERVLSASHCATHSI